MAKTQSNSKQKRAQADVLVYVCRNSIPDGARLASQWNRDGVLVALRVIPCSGKIDAQYLFHALEGGSAGICVVACPTGECHYAEGNYRADIRVKMVRKLLGEIGLEGERVELLHWSAEDSIEGLRGQIDIAVDRLGALGRCLEHCGQEGNTEQTAAGG